MRTPCTICGLPSVGRGFCKKHYRAFMAYGDPLEAKNLRGVPFGERYVVDPDSGCWLWIGSTVTCGYGIWHAHGQHTAHRASYVMHKGPIPGGLHVLHKCDRPGCVNPDHLFLGTHQDNMADLRTKGRAYGAKGIANFGAKLTELQVLSIMADPRPALMLAEQYGVSKTSIDHIRNGKTWRHIFDETVKARRIAAGPRRLTSEERARIATDPRRQIDIAAEYGVTQGFVSAIKRASIK